MRGSRHLKTPAVLFVPPSTLPTWVKSGDEWIEQINSQPAKPTETPVKVDAMPRSDSLDRRLSIKGSVDATGKLESEYTLAVVMTIEPPTGSQIKIKGKTYRQIGQTIKSLFDDANNEYIMLLAEL